MSIDTFMVFVSNWGAAVPLLCVLLTRDRKAITNMIISLLLTWGVTNALKLAIARPRPFLAGMPLIGEAPDGYSFPSQHASFSFSAATIAALKNQALGIIAILSAALVAYSRVYLGVHYWSDILIGAVLGTAISYGVHQAQQHLETRNNKRKRR
jgi:undecaprenyl-diphosphatase